MMRYNEEPEVYGDPLWSRAGSTINSHGEVQTDRISYQTALRALGSFLDQHKARRINLLEAGDGFAVRYQETANSPDYVMARLPHAELVSVAAELERKRKRMSFPFGGRDAGTRANYENVLRALGYELDHVEAYSLLVDEIDDGMVVTYQYLKPSEGFNARKRMVILGTDAMHAVLADAQARREQRKHGVLTLLAG
jgi:hypothetical protein